mmetsp:Transcript_73791/g.130084  ORF Transcript_73791/g.130084 Transcript_73791/m.130084 type:complete len:243 (-) Transcript_73791:2021-2749(-)
MQPTGPVPLPAPSPRHVLRTAGCKPVGAGVVTPGPWPRGAHGVRPPGGPTNGAAPTARQIVVPLVRVLRAVHRPPRRPSGSGPSAVHARTGGPRRAPSGVCEAVVLPVGVHFTGELHIEDLLLQLLLQLLEVVNDVVVVGAGQHVLGVAVVVLWDLYHYCCLILGGLHLHLRITGHVVDRLGFRRRDAFIVQHLLTEAADHEGNVRAFWLLRLVWPGGGVPGAGWQGVDHQALRWQQCGTHW